MCNLLAGAAGCELPTVDFQAEQRSSSDAASQLRCAVLCVECEKEEEKGGQKIMAVAPLRGRARQRCTVAPSINHNF